MEESVSFSFSREDPLTNPMKPLRCESVGAWAAQLGSAW
jgi:hypothetical protein